MVWTTRINVITRSGILTRTIWFNAAGGDHVVRSVLPLELTVESELLRQNSPTFQTKILRNHPTNMISTQKSSSLHLVVTRHAYIVLTLRNVSSVVATIKLSQRFEDMNWVNTLECDGQDA